MEYPKSIQLPFNVLPCELKEHNIRAYNEAKEQIELYGRSAIVQPTGTGKSYVMMKIMQDFGDELKIILGPSKGALIELESKPEWIEQNSIVYTYSNSHNLVDMLSGYGVSNVKLIVLDELHRVGAATWGSNVKQLLSMFPDAAVLGLTATPIRFLDSKRDMVSELFNGISAGNLTLQQAIEQGILPAPIYVTAMFDISEDIRNRLVKINSRTKKKGKSTDVVTQEKANEAIQIIDEYQSSWQRDESIVDILKVHIGEFCDKNYKHIIFVPKIELADSMRGIVQTWFEKVYPGININVYVVHSGNNYRDSELEGFCYQKNAGNIDVMIAVNMANEGFHIDNTKSVMMLRYTNSPNIYLQQIGRALASGGENPIIFDFIGNIDAVGNVTAFLNTMEAKVSNILQDQVHEQVRHKVSKLFKSYEDHTKDFRQLINKVDRMVSNNWDSNMYTLRDIVENEDLIDFDKIQDKGLAKWARDQQKAFLNGDMTAEKSERFKELGRVAYTTQSMIFYGVDWLELVEKLKNGDRDSINTAMESSLKYRLYCNSLPNELVTYIRDTELDLELNESWFKSTCERYNKATTDRFYEVINTVLNDGRLRINSEAFDTQVYMETIQSVLRLKSLFEKYRDKEDSAKAVLINMFARYWKIHNSQIASKIEIDTGTLENHCLICKLALGISLDDEEQKALENNIIKVQKNIRAMSTNNIIERLKGSLPDYTVS